MNTKRPYVLRSYHGSCPRVHTRVRLSANVFAFAFAGTEAVAAVAAAIVVAAHNERPTSGVYVRCSSPGQHASRTQNND